MDPESKEYKLLSDTLESLYKYLETPWGKGVLGMKARKHTERVTNGLVEQLRPYLDEMYIGWLKENMQTIQKLVNCDWEGRGRHTVDVKKIRNIINHTQTVFDKTTSVYGPCVRF